MPSPKRWHPVSRDLNDDPELWEFTTRFGDRALRLWLEILAVLDRQENQWRLTGEWLKFLSRKTRQYPKNCSSQVLYLISIGFISVLQRNLDGSPLVLSLPNYWKYHKRKETKGEKHGTAPGSDVGPSLPYPNLSEPSLPKEEEKEKRRREPRATSARPPLEFVLTLEKTEELKKAFPTIDVEREIDKLRSYCLTEKKPFTLRRILNTLKTARPSKVSHDWRGTLRAGTRAN